MPEIKAQERRFWRRALAIMLLVLLATFVFCVLTGQYPCGKDEVFLILGRGLFDVVIWVLQVPAMIIPGVSYTIPNPIPITWNQNVATVVWNIRITRIVGVIFVGGGLAIAGASYQCLFRNPLVSESILGVSNGAGFGACLALFFMLGTTFVNIFAFAGGLLAVFLTYNCSKVLRGNRTLLLVLTGMVVSSIFSAGISIVKYIAPTDTTLPEITFWLMGSFGKIGVNDLPLLIGVITICSLIVIHYRWQMNVLSLGDEEARALGVNVNRIRAVIIVCSTLIASVSVCVCGAVSWVGIIIPQITRSIVGPDTRKLIPCTFFTGAVFLMLVDVVCRGFLSVEIPVSIVTSVIGAPMFFIILLRAKAAWA